MLVPEKSKGNLSGMLQVEGSLFRREYNALDSPGSIFQANSRPCTGCTYSYNQWTGLLDWTITDTILSSHLLLAGGLGLVKRFAKRTS